MSTKISKTQTNLKKSTKKKNPKNFKEAVKKTPKNV